MAVPWMLPFSWTPILCATTDENAEECKEMLKPVEWSVVIIIKAPNKSYFRIGQREDGGPWLLW